MQAVDLATFELEQKPSQIGKVLDIVTQLEANLRNTIGRDRLL